MTDWADALLSGKPPPEVTSASNRTSLSPEEETKFQGWIRGHPWFTEFKQQWGEEPNINAPEYDLRGAWKAGIEPIRYKYDRKPLANEQGIYDEVNAYHWPSQFKSEDHPTMWMEKFMQRFGYDPNSKGISKEKGLEMLKQKADIPEEGPPKQDWAGLLLRGEKPIEVKEVTEPTTTTTSVSTTEGIDDTSAGAGLLTLYKTANVDNLEARRDIYAAARFRNDWKESPDKARSHYKIQNGSIYYKGEDGRWYDETPETFVGGLKVGGARALADLPSYVLAGLAAYQTGGMTAPALGAMAGESFRKFMGTMFGEKMNWPAWAQDVGMAGLLEAFGVKAGDALTATANKLLRRQGGTLSRAMGKDVNAINPEEAVRNYARGKDYGIDLFPHQATESRQLTQRFSLLRDLDQSADIIERGVKIQDDQVKDAVYGVLDRFSKPLSADEAGEGLVKGARKVMDKLKAERLAKAQPFYQKAFNPNNVADTTDLVDWVKATIPQKKGSTATALKRLLRDDMLYRKVVDPQTGKEVLRRETRMQQLQSVKEELDDMIGVAKRAGKNKRAATLLEAKERLLTSMDNASADYKTARSIWSEESGQMENLTKGRIVESIGKLEGDKIIGAVTKIVSNQTSPKAIRTAKGLIEQASPGSWDAGVRNHLETVFEGLKDVAPGRTGVRLKKAIMGSPMQRNRLKAALGENKYGVLEDFADILDKTGLGMSKESATATRSGLMSDMQAQAEGFKGRVFKAAAYPLVTGKKILYDRWAKLAFGADVQRLAEAMLSPTAAQSIARIKQLPAGSVKQVRALSGFLALVSQGEYSDDWQRPGRIRQAAAKAGRTVSSLIGVGSDEGE